MAKVLVIGSGPIIIGQGAEFDYSGTQACLALKEEGHEVILVNNNPATIMTDKSIVDKVYFEPLEFEFIKKVVEQEKPDMLLPTLGGQTGLNLTYELAEENVLEENHVKVIGTNLKTIKLAEDRELFKNFLIDIGEPIIESKIISSVEDGLAYIEQIGYPAVVRPAYTLGGTGGGHVENKEQLIKKVKSGIKYSLVGQVLIEKSISGFKEIEYEIMRDKNGTCISVCNMENIDPVGIHTGDSIVIAPSQTLNDNEYQLLRQASVKIVNNLEIEGGCNVQLALNPENDKYYVIEVNPRVSRSSSLASKATGYPIAKIATKVALGQNLHEIKNDITQKSFASFEPTLDYCVVKIPKWPFDKFLEADKGLGTTMKATGEVMAIGNNFSSALLKALRALEIDQFTLDFEEVKQFNLNELLDKIKKPCSERLYLIAELIRREVSILLINKITKIDMFYLAKFKEIIELEKEIKDREFKYIGLDQFKQLKQKGFSDEGIAELTIGATVKDIFQYRKENDILPSYQMVDTCGGEFDAVSPYYYSTYDDFDESDISNKEKVIVLGSGPIRIGQGVEFDYSTVRSIMKLNKMGYESIVVNNNPETVSTDFDMSDKLYFEPITKEDIINIINIEKPKGVILQFGGQTSIKLAKFLDEMGVNILGTDFEAIHKCEAREEFIKILEENNIKYPKGIGVYSLEEGMEQAKDLKYPLLVRPSYVLGGQGMKIVKTEQQLKDFLQNAFDGHENSVLIDEYIYGIELEVDAVTDGTDVFIPGIMEHLEKAGVHSGDSIAIYPSQSIDMKIKEEIYEITKKLAVGVGAKGLINIQLIYQDDELYVVEVNPRASRTVPFISKVTEVPLVDIATEAMLGHKLEATGLKEEQEFFAIKGPIFSMDKIENAEIALGPVMKSTGETLSISKDLNEALYKNFVSLFGKSIFDVGNDQKIILSITDEYKEKFELIVQKLDQLGFKLYGTEGTYQHFKDLVTMESYDETIEDYKFMVNMPSNADSVDTKGFMLRRKSIEENIPVFTSYDTIKTLVDLYMLRFDYKKINIYSS